MGKSNKRVPHSDTLGIRDVLVVNKNKNAKWKDANIGTTGSHQPLFKGE